MGTMYQGSLAKFDRKTKTFQTWGSPTFKDRDEARIAMVMPINADVDGQVWIGGDNEYQVDVKTGEWKTRRLRASACRKTPRSSRSSARTAWRRTRRTTSTG